MRRNHCGIVPEQAAGGARTRAFRCVTEEDLRSGAAVRVPGGEYDSDEECEARCSAPLSLPPEVGEQIAELLPPGAAAALARTSAGGARLAARELGRERAVCDALRAEYPLVWQEWAGPEYSPARIAQTCRVWGLPCLRPCTEMRGRLLRRYTVELPGEPSREFAQQMDPDQPALVFRTYGPWDLPQGSMTLLLGNTVDIAVGDQVLPRH